MKRIEGGVLDRTADLKSQYVLPDAGLLYSNTLRNTLLFSYPKQISIQGHTVEWQFENIQKSRTGGVGSLGAHVIKDKQLVIGKDSADDMDEAVL